MNPVQIALRISHKLVRIDKLEAHDRARRAAYYERMRQDVVQGLAPEVRRVLEAASLLPEHLRTPPLQSEPEPPFGTATPDSDKQAPMDAEFPEADPYEAPAIPAALLREPEPIAPGSRIEIPDRAKRARGR
jgi:hypothetical protein